MCVPQKEMVIQTMSKERCVEEMSMTTDGVRMLDEDLKKKLNANKNCHQLSNQASPTTPRCFEKSLSFTCLHSKVMKNEKISAPPKVLKQLQDVQMDVKTCPL